MDLGLTGVAVFISGSYRGTGKAMAARFITEGAEVWVHGLQQEQAQQCAQELGAAGAIWGDVANDAGQQQVIEQLTQQCPQLQVLVNNYGGAESWNWQKNHSASWREAWNKSYDKNVLSAVGLINGLLPIIQQQSWGRIIQLATVGTQKPNRIMPQYYAAKAALANLTVSLARELAGSRITVNTISPGIIHTSEVEAMYRIRAAKKGWGDDWAEIEKQVVAHDFPNFCKRMAQPEEVADAVCFIASQRAAYINGQQWNIDGGFVGVV